MIPSRGKLTQCIHRMARGCFLTSRSSSLFVAAAPSTLIEESPPPSLLFSRLISNTRESASQICNLFSEPRIDPQNNGNCRQNLVKLGFVSSPSTLEIQPSNESQKTPEAARPKVGFVSLGCPKNLVDSEVMMGLLHRGGADLTPRAE